MEKSFKSGITYLDQKVQSSIFPLSFSNEVYYSKLEKAHPISMKYISNYSIKYVLRGEEAYQLGSKRFTVSPSQYLLVNDGQEVETSPTSASEGISIFLDQGTLSEVYSALQHSENTLLEAGTEQIDQALPHFFENAFPAQDALGTLLQCLYLDITSRELKKISLSKTWYFLLAEKLIQSQKQVRHEIGNIQSVKRATREELYRRALLAQSYIQDHATCALHIEEVSRYAGLSQFHLIRVFKSAFRITPYQFHLHCKVEIAKNLLRHSNQSMGEIADQCGFSDVFAFSKTFKKITTCSPSEFRTRSK